jgi:hypothetical protein
MYFTENLFRTQLLQEKSIKSHLSESMKSLQLF